MLAALSRLVEVFASLTLLGPGVLAPADVGVLERVEATRVKHGYGLTHYGPQAAIRVAVEDCALLGYQGFMLVDDIALSVYVVDCQQQGHKPLSELGLVADVNRPDLGHKQAALILWKYSERVLLH